MSAQNYEKLTLFSRISRKISAEKFPVEGATEKTRPKNTVDAHASSSLVRKMSAGDQPLCLCEHTISFEISEDFFTKKYGRLHLNAPSSEKYLNWTKRLPDCRCIL